MRRDGTLPFDPVAETRRQWTAAGWAEAADGVAVVGSVMRVQKLFIVQSDRTLKPFGLTYARYEILMLLHFSRTGSLTLGRLRSRLQVQPGAITNSVDRLEADALLNRVPHPSDNRTTLAVLTPKGRKLAKRATIRLNEVLYENLGIDQETSRTLFSMLREIRLNADDFLDPTKVDEPSAPR
jgi:DNA-binding MarR family transcriptional regulator